MSFERHEQNPAPSVKARTAAQPTVQRFDSNAESSIGDGSFNSENWMRYVTIEKAASITGLTAKAIRRKKEDGVWIEHREWVKGPDNRIYIDLVGFAKWVKPWR